MTNRYGLTSRREFRIRQYNQAKKFSNFLPGIAGVRGKPLWLFYVNRGQCVSSMGTNNKDNAILEFYAANKAYMLTPLHGFRTFLKLHMAGAARTVHYEPFQIGRDGTPRATTQDLYVSPHELRLEEVNEELGLELRVVYHTLPEARVAGLVRELRIKNIGRGERRVALLDGLPVIVPHYIDEMFLKYQSNVNETIGQVLHHEDIPFYKIDAVWGDAAETAFVSGGNFHLSFSLTESGELIKAPMLVDPALVFGPASDCVSPMAYYDERFALPEQQTTSGIGLCGFGYHEVVLAEQEESALYSVTGHGDSFEQVKAFFGGLTRAELANKRARNEAIVGEIMQSALTVSSSREFDEYCKQSFLDNTMRGGYPLLLGNGRHVFNVYSRKHGDPEREYNFFQVDATYYSQGNGHYRDINQNRRTEVSVFPFTDTSSIELFINLIELNGTNPLEYLKVVFSAEDQAKARALTERYLPSSMRSRVQTLLGGSFSPGELLALVIDHEEGLAVEAGEEFLNAVLAICRREEIAAATLHGFWSDHFTYNIDLLEQYRATFPDRFLDVLMRRKKFTWFDSGIDVLPRSKKYVLTEKGPRQSVAIAKNQAKEALLRARTSEVNRVRIDHGKGGVHRTTLLCKLVCLILNKIATLDPENVGLEMDAGRPGWCDAFNGLPSLFGSSLNETAEIKRLAVLLLEAFAEYGVGLQESVQLPEEIAAFLDGMDALLAQPTTPWEYWEGSGRLREAYWAEVSLGLSGLESEVTLAVLRRFLEKVVVKVEQALAKAYDESGGLYHTYFVNAVTKHEPILGEDGTQLLNERGLPLIRPLEVRQRPLPTCLEGQVRALRVLNEPSRGRALFKAIKASPLYDTALKMYKVNVSLASEPRELGRMSTYPRGRFENEAVFLHLEYKYFLELLRAGLYEEFFECFKDALVPFTDPALYGRSILENSSYIVTSVNPNKEIHGLGCMPRLTGATVEVITMWLYMTAGQRPFRLDDRGALILALSPTLPGWLFTETERNVEVYCNGTQRTIELPANVFAFMFAGKALTVYHNARRKDTFGKEAARIARISLDDGGTATRTIEGNVLTSADAAAVRDGRVQRIDVFLE
jgi:hypothetical protein